MALFAFKKNKHWIFKVYDSVSGRLVDWECGRRNTATLRRLLARLRHLNVRWFCTDNWRGYAQEIPHYRLAQSKRLTTGIEQNNMRQRHWFIRFARRTCVVSRSAEMVDLTISLFANYRVNGTIADIFHTHKLCIAS